MHYGHQLGVHGQYTDHIVATFITICKYYIIIDLFLPPLCLPVTLPLELVKDDKTELSLIGRRDNKLLGRSKFVISKFSIITIVLTLNTT